MMYNLLISGKFWSGAPPELAGEDDQSLAPASLQHARVYAMWIHVCACLDVCLVVIALTVPRLP